MSGTNGVHREEAGSVENLEGLRLKLKKITESAALDFCGIIGAGFDPYDLMQDVSSGWSPYPYNVPAWYRQSQKRGEVIPIYLDENNLRFIRDRSRKLCTENPFCICAIENLKNYAVGDEGFIIRAVPAKKGCPLDLLEKVQNVINLWREANDMSEIENDIVEQGTVDGDAFLRHFRQPSGLVLHRPIEPEHIRSPIGESYGPKYSFGIQTDPDDVLTVEGYWNIQRPLTDPNPSFVPAEDVTHFKFNTRRSAKRGLPTFYSCDLLLRDAVDLLRGTVVTANARARYAVIRKFSSGIIKEAASNMLAELNFATVTDPGSGATINVEKKPFGSIVNLGANQELEFPSANMESDQFYKALQMVLRSIAARLNMPEWMLTADASNTNYSSSMVAEAPSTKMFKRLQANLGKKIGQNRAPGKESLAWIQVKWAVRMGVLPPETLRLVKLQCEGPSLVVRDKGGEAATNKIYFEMQVKSRQTMQQELGLDPDRERENFNEDLQRHIEMTPLEREVHAQMKAIIQPADGSSDPTKQGSAGSGSGKEYSSEGKDGHPPAGRAAPQK